MAQTAALAGGRMRWPTTGYRRRACWRPTGRTWPICAPFVTRGPQVGIVDLLRTSGDLSAIPGASGPRRVRCTGLTVYSGSQRLRATPIYCLCDGGLRTGNRPRKEVFTFRARAAVFRIPTCTAIKGGKEIPVGRWTESRFEMACGFRPRRFLEMRARSIVMANCPLHWTTDCQHWITERRGWGRVSAARTQASKTERRAA